MTIVSSVPSVASDRLLSVKRCAAQSTKVPASVLDHAMG